MTAGLISTTKGDATTPRIVSAEPQETVAEVLAKMDKFGLTQMPVIEDGKPVGAARENRILARVLANRDLLDGPVSEVMGESFPVVDVDATSNEVKRLLGRSPAVLVEEYGRITGIITRHDMLDTR